MNDYARLNLTRREIESTVCILLMGMGETMEINERLVYYGAE